MPFSDGNFKPRTFANIRTNKDTKETFLEIKKDDVLLKKRDYTGFLKEVRIKNWEYEGKPKESILFIFDEPDRESEVWVETGWSMLARNILNTLASSKGIGKVKIALYKNDKGYASSYIEINDQKAGWKYQVSDLPAVEKKMFKGEEVIDDFEVIQFFKNTIIPEINSHILGDLRAEIESEKPKSKEQESFIGDTGDEQGEKFIDDLPF